MGEREGDWIQAEVNVSSKLLLVFIKCNYLEDEHREDWLKELGLFGCKTHQTGGNLKTVFERLN